jgi:hypothetical protein
VTQEKLEKFGGATRLGRGGQPAELGSIYLQLAASDGSFATGQIYGAAGEAVSLDRAPVLAKVSSDRSSR